jgi:BMFP domain-containing protein YqiC
MLKTKLIDTVLHQLLNAVPEGMSHARSELEKNFHSILQSAFAKLDLVTREEFDAQVKVLQRTRQKLETLEAQFKQKDNT